MNHIPDETLSELKARLGGELSSLEKELEAIGRRNPSNPADWEAEAPTDETQPGDLNEAADKIEGYEENTALLKELEIRYNNVRGALDRIEKRSYGICEIDHKPIELERLTANPAARTCVEHKDESL